MSTDIDYPATLPLPTMQDYAVQPAPNVDRTEVDIGQARQRKRSTTTTDRIPVRFSFTLWQLLIFEGFYKHDAMEGAVWFNIPLLGGVGLANHEARFLIGEQLRWQPLSGNRWTATATLEIRDRPTISAEDYAFLVAEDIDAFMAALAAFDAALHAMP